MEHGAIEPPATSPATRPLCTWTTPDYEWCTDADQRAALALCGGDPDCTLGADHACACGLNHRALGHDLTRVCAVCCADVDVCRADPSIPGHG